MDYKQEIFDIISRLTGHNNLLTVNVAFVDYTGDLETGLFLSQLIYWSDRGGRQDGFIYKSAKEWQEELRLSEYSIRKSRKTLEKMGILETKLKKANGNPTVHYKLLKDVFTQDFNSFLRNQQNGIAKTQNGNGENANSLTEITTDTSTEKKKYAPRVQMTTDEYNKLIEKLGNEETVKDFIERLDLYKGSTGTKYKDDYLTILNWHRKDKKKTPAKPKQSLEQYKSDSADSTSLFSY